MAFFQRCECCHKTKFYIKKRTYKNVKGVGVMYSKGQLCGKCYRGLRKLIP